MIGLIRDDIGFGGLLMTDDLSMNALPGDMRDRTLAARAAGCDVALHCNGDADEMASVAEHAGPLDKAGRQRLDEALGRLGEPEFLHVPAAVSRIDEALDRAERGGPL